MALQLLCIMVLEIFSVIRFVNRCNQLCLKEGIANLYEILVDKFILLPKSEHRLNFCEILTRLNMTFIKFLYYTPDIGK